MAKENAPEIINFDQAAANDMTAIKNRRAQLAAQLSSVVGKLNSARDELGKQVAEGRDARELGKQIAEWSEEIMALEAGITYLELQAQKIYRLNYWMQVR